MSMRVRQSTFFSLDLIWQLIINVSFHAIQLNATQREKKFFFFYIFHVCYGVIVCILRYNCIEFFDFLSIRTSSSSHLVSRERDLAMAARRCAADVGNSISRPTERSRDHAYICMCVVMVPHIEGSSVKAIEVVRARLYTIFSRRRRVRCLKIFLNPSNTEFLSHEKSYKITFVLFYTNVLYFNASSLNFVRANVQYIS